MPDGTSSTLHEIKISELPVAPAVSDSDQLEANQSGTSRSITVGQVKAAAVAAVPIPPAITDTSPRSFGAVGDGVTDDTAALQAAINAVSAAGGGNVNCTGGRWLIDSADLLVRNGVFLVGSWNNYGRPGDVRTDFSAVKTSFIINPSFTINLVDCDCGIRGMVILRKGLTNPTTVRQGVDLVVSFAGTAITLGDGIAQTANDCWLSHLFIGGFATAISSNFNDRMHIEYIQGDNTNGVYITKCYDMDHLSHVHFWPFLTAGLPVTTYGVSGAVNNGSGLVRLTLAANVLRTGDRVTAGGVGGVTGATGPFVVTVINPTTVDLQGSTFGGAYTSGGTVYLNSAYRSGVGINFDVDVDWGQMDQCFTYNYAIGIRVNSSNQVTLVNCGTDSYGAAADTSTVGILVTGTAQAASLTGCKTSAQGVNLKIDTTAAQRATVHVTGHRSWGAVIYSYQAANGHGSFVNCEADTSTVRIDDSGSASFVGGDLTGVTYAYQSAASPRPSRANVRGVSSVLNPVLNAGGSTSLVSRFEGHFPTPAANNTITNSYFLTDSSNSQIQAVNESYRLTSVTAGAYASQILWGTATGGAINNQMALNGAGSLCLGTLNTTVNFSAIGTTLTPSLQIAGSTPDPSISLQRYATSANGPALNFSKSQTSGALGTQGIVGSTENLGFISFNGSDGTQFVEGASITAKVEGTPGTNAMPCRLMFQVSPSASATPVERLRISAAGDTITNPTLVVGAGAATQAFIKASSTANLGLYFGTGAPGFSAAKGSLYTCTNATTTTTRLYVNTDGAATWTNLTTAA